MLTLTQVRRLKLRRAYLRTLYRCTLASSGRAQSRSSWFEHRTLPPSSYYTSFVRLGWVGDDHAVRFNIVDCARRLPVHVRAVGGRCGSGATGRCSDGGILIPLGSAGLLLLSWPALPVPLSWTVL
jgi:hypothetical protein